MANRADLMPEAFFITGAPRSGTTLLARLLAAQRGMSVLSQPFPLLFVDAKRAFLRSVGGGGDRYPLGHLFLEARYERSAFDAFLGGWRPSAAEIDRVFTEMQSYSGQYTRFSADAVARACEAVADAPDFPDVAAGLSRALAGGAGARRHGSKETICEEFVPALLSRGITCVVIVRDPRDAIASLNHGRGPTFGGAVKPTLFNVRQWRKSVACVAAMETDPRFHWCRYEDLVTDSTRALVRVMRAIGVDGDPAAVAARIREATGAAWRGNSSYRELDGVSRASVGMHREVLPAGVAAAIEAGCLPELQWLGYETTLTRADAVRVLGAFRDPYDVTTEGLDGDVATAETAGREAARLARVTEPPGAESARWFVFARAHETLRKAFRP